MIDTPIRDETPAQEATLAVSTSESAPADESMCARGRRKLWQYSGIGGGALFVLVPNSELIHSAFRAFAGASVGYQCC